MSTSVLVKTGEALCSLLANHIPDSAYTSTQNGDSKFVPADAVRRNYGTYILKLEDSAAEELRIDVVLQNSGIDWDDEGDMKWTPTFDAIIRIKFTSDERLDDGAVDQAITDDLVLLMEQLLLVVTEAGHRVLPDYEAAVLMKAEIKSIAPANYLKQNAQFVARLGLTYEVVP